MFLEKGPVPGSERRAEEIGDAVYGNKSFETLQNLNDEDLKEGIKSMMGEMSSEHTRAQLTQKAESLKSQDLTSDNSLEAQNKKRFLEAWESYNQSRS